MAECKQISGVETRFYDWEIRLLVNHFRCKNLADLTKAAKRYENLFFMFTSEEYGVDMLPGEDMQLVLLLAQHSVFENFSELDEPLRRRYLSPSKRGPGRARRKPLPDDIGVHFKEARKSGLTKEQAIRKLKMSGILKSSHYEGVKLKTLMRYIQEAEKRRLEFVEEEEQRMLDMLEAFKDIETTYPSAVKDTASDRSD